ncbi:MAG: pyridoxal-phosphate dependent enzyme [Armatimonadetes bacterium]|nr:pyridoxal-phosphate dependent enzyme [Armatimonadota bacterium]
MSEKLGIDLWIKRDDLTGFALGGNKGRKLEYLMARAVADGIEAIVTCGAAQSNFIRQLGAACSVCGIECHAAIMQLPFDSSAEKIEVEAVEPGNGNILLDQILGINLHLFPDDDWEVLYDYAAKICAELQAGGKKVMNIPVGGSNFLGAYAFTQAALELAEEFDTIVFASSSGSTHVGLATALHGSKTKVLGIACDPEPEIVHDFAALSESLARETGMPKITAEEFNVNLDFVGAGYGIASEEGMIALKNLAQTEGIFLDPIYTAKAFAALIHLATTGKLRGKVLFWHTGGIPALFGSIPNLNT